MNRINIPIIQFKTKALRQLFNQLYIDLQVTRLLVKTRHD